MKSRLNKYQPKEIEEKWRSVWRKSSINLFAENKTKNKYYCLVELPYPSGDLHLGHWFTFVCADAHARYKRMSGSNVFFPNGFDAFGLPAENAAIKRGIHPKDWTMANIETMKKQFETMGTMIDWSHETITCLPEYYKWNQWIFIKMYEKGLAYRGTALSNWCPSCQTVLANEGIEDGKCWRCGSIVIQKEIEQWFLRITDYADKLLWNNTQEGKKSNNVDWPKSVREGQNNWIGRSEGAEIEFGIMNQESRIKVFTTRPDTLYGATFLVVSPEHPFCEQMVNGKWQMEENVKSEVLGYVEKAKKKTEMERKEQKDKTGVFSGINAIHPITKEEIPVWVADYVLWGYGTGAIMAVPAHDERDFEFAKKYNLPIIPVIRHDKQNVIVIHGCPSDEEEASEFAGHWMPWLQKELEEKGWDITIQIMPTPWVPSYKKWKEQIEKLSVTEDTILIGHSCGSAFLVKWLAETGQKIKKLILVAPAKIPDSMGDKRVQLYDFEIDEKLKGQFQEIVVFTSDTEIERHRKSAKLYYGKLGGRYRELPNKGHYTFEDMGTSEFPELLEEVVSPEQSCTGGGRLINSGEWNGLSVPRDIGKVIDWLSEKKLGKRRVEYHLHDWSISRQRYWGTPVPMINCDKCGIIPVPLDDLPVELPYEVDYTPKGRPPLATAKDWIKVKCPKCGSDSKRDSETLDTFFDSSWYYYRYLDPKFDKEPFDRNLAKKTMPVDIYFGGAEHTLGHTLYARFFTKFFEELGLIDFSEFAHKRVQHGVILGPDGFRMSKSRGNVVNPDDVVREYGSDTVRMFLCFMMPYAATAPWNPSAISGVYRFLRRIWELIDKVYGSQEIELKQEDQFQMHKTIKKVGEDIENIQFNTAVASVMEWLNYLSKKDKVTVEEYKNLLILIAPFAPHIAEELYQALFSLIEAEKTEVKKLSSIHVQPWPEYKEIYLKEDVLTIVIQVNGKMRDSIKVGLEMVNVQAKIEKLAKENPKITSYLDGREIRKVIYVPGKIINFVV